MWTDPAFAAPLAILTLWLVALVFHFLPPIRRKEFREKSQAYNRAFELSRHGQYVSYILQHEKRGTFRVSAEPKMDGYHCIDRVHSMAYNTGR